MRFQVNGNHVCREKQTLLEAVNVSYQFNDLNVKLLHQIKMAPVILEDDFPLGKELSIKEPKTNGR